MIRFFLTIFFAGVSLTAIFWALVKQQFIVQLPSYFFQTFGFLLFGTTLIYLYLFRSNKTGLFVQFYLLTMAVKLLAYGAYNLMMVRDDIQGAFANVIWFMVIYFVFTGIEIAFLYRKIVAG